MAARPVILFEGMRADSPLVLAVMAMMGGVGVAWRRIYPRGCARRANGVPTIGAARRNQTATNTDRNVFLPVRRVGALAPRYSK